MYSNEMKMSVISKLREMGYAVKEGVGLRGPAVEVRSPQGTISILVYNDFFEDRVATNASVIDTAAFVAHEADTAYRNDVSRNAGNLIDSLTIEDLFLALKPAEKSDSDSISIERPCSVCGMREKVREYLCFMPRNSGLVIPVTALNRCFVEEKTGISIEELWPVALKNTRQATHLQRMDEIIPFIQDDDDLCLYVLTLKDRIKGAAAILNKSAIAELAQRIDVNEFIVIPSSVNEVLLMPVTQYTPPISEVSSTVRMMNSTLEKRMILSNEAFYYAV